MSRQRHRRSSVNVNRAQRELASSAADGATLALLFDILAGDCAWTMAEVRRLISVREFADLGRWRVAGLDEAEPGAR